MSPEARLFAMTFGLALLASALFGLGRFGVWLQAREEQRAREPKVSSVSVKLAQSSAADETDRQTDKRVSAASGQPTPQQVDRTRAGIIYTLVRDGWTTSEMRPWLRGDNNTISAEIAEARNRLNMASESRIIAVRTHENGQRVERDIAL